MNQFTNQFLSWDGPVKRHAQLRPPCGVLKFRHLLRTFSPLLLFLLSVSTTFAQVITYPTPAESLTRGMGKSKLTVNLGFTAACTGVNVEVQLPDGVSYVASSVLATSATGGLTISENGGTANRPKFLIGTAAIGNNITFTIERLANCGIDASGKDAIYVTSSCASVNEVDPNINSYNLLAPALSLIPPAAVVNGNIGTAYSRSFSVTNGGNGCLDTLRIGVVRPSGSIASPVIKIGAVTIPASSMVGDTTFYKVFGSSLPGGDNLMCNGETVNFTEDFTLVNCLGLTTTYVASWGRKKNLVCQNASGTALVNMNTGVPNLSIVNSAPAITSCRATRPITITVTNNGSAPASSVKVRFGSLLNGVFTFYTGGYIDTASVMVTPSVGAAYHPSGITVAGKIDLTVTTGAPSCAANAPALVDLQFPSGFSLAPGKSVTITYNVLNCGSGVCGEGIIDSRFNSSAVEYKDQCNNAPYSLVGNNIDNGYYAFQGINAQIPAQVIAGQCFDYKVEMNMLADAYYAKSYVDYAIDIPSGVTFNSVSELSGQSIHTGYPKLVGGIAIFYWRNLQGIF